MPPLSLGSRTAASEMVTIETSVSCYRWLAAEEARGVCLRRHPHWKAIAATGGAHRWGERGETTRCRQDE